MNMKLIALVGAFFCPLLGLSQWQLPSSDRHYNEVCFLTSHNSYAATRHGYYYAQQNLTIEEQLNAGVRGLMLDTVEDSSHTVLLCHKGEALTHILCRGKAPMPLSKALKTIKKFLEKHPQEIITIFLENYVKDKHVLDNTFSSAGLESLILSPLQWNPDTQNGWPTLAWMQKENKRLVIFNSLGKTSFAFNQWEHVVENQWGVLHTAKACKERKESIPWRSKKRSLYLLNYFPAFQLKWHNPHQHINTKGLDDFLKRVVKMGLNKHYCINRLPNFIALDFVDIGNCMHHVNSFNSNQVDAFHTLIK